MMQKRNSITVRPFVEAYCQAVEKIAAGLTDWFDERAKDSHSCVDIRHNRVFVAEYEGKIVGFITLYVGDGRLNIGWMGVRQDLHRRGIGRLLLKKDEEVCRSLGLKELSTVTLGDKVDYEPYERTRRFYFKNGFRIFQRSQTDNPSCPEEIKISKKIFPVIGGSVERRRLNAMKRQISGA